MALWIDVLHRTDREPVSSRILAIDVEVEVIAPYRAIAKCRCGFRDASSSPARCSREMLLQDSEVRSRDFDTNRRFYPCGKHVDARFNRHRPGVGQSGELNGPIHLIHQFFC